MRVRARVKMNFGCFVLVLLVFTACIGTFVMGQVYPVAMQLTSERGTSSLISVMAGIVLTYAVYETLRHVVNHGYHEDEEN